MIFPSKILFVSIVTVLSALPGVGRAESYAPAPTRRDTLLQAPTVAAGHFTGEQQTVIADDSGSNSSGPFTFKRQIEVRTFMIEEILEGQELAGSIPVLLLGGADGSAPSLEPPQPELRTAVGLQPLTVGEVKGYIVLHQQFFPAKTEGQLAGLRAYVVAMRSEQREQIEQRRAAEQAAEAEGRRVAEEEAKEAAGVPDPLSVAQREPRSAPLAPAELAESARFSQPRQAAPQEPTPEAESVLSAAVVQTLTQKLQEGQAGSAAKRTAEGREDSSATDPFEARTATDAEPRRFPWSGLLAVGLGVALLFWVRMRRAAGAALQ